LCEKQDVVEAGVEDRLNEFAGTLCARIWRLRLLGSAIGLLFLEVGEELVVVAGWRGTRRRRWLARNSSSSLDSFLPTRPQVDDAKLQRSFGSSFGS
jgi:hypothetical protein